MVSDANRLESALARRAWTDLDADRLEWLADQIHHFLSMIVAWIDEGLLSEPLEFSEAAGNLVILGDRIGRLQERSGAVCDPDWLPLVDRLNEHHLALADLSGPLRRLRSQYEVDSDPLTRLQAWKQVRRRLPRARLPIEGMRDLEPLFAKWILEPARSLEDQRRAIEFLDGHVPLTSPLEQAARALKESWETGRRMRVAASLREEIDALDVEHAPVEALDAVASRLRTELGQGGLPPGFDWGSDAARLEQRSSERKAEVERQVQAAVALAELERVLDEGGSLRDVERCYARARTLHGPLGHVFEARVRRRLEIERTVRLRRFGVASVVVLAVIGAVSVLLWRHFESARRHDLAIAIAAEARNAIEEGRPDDVAGIIADAVRQDPEVGDDPVIAVVRADAIAAVEQRARVIADACRRVRDAVAIVASGSPVRQAKSVLSSIEAESVPRYGGEFEACLNEAVTRVAEIEAERVDLAIDQLMPPFDRAETMLARLDVSGPATSIARRFDPDAWGQVESEVAVARAEIEQVLESHSEDLEKFREWRQRTAVLLSRLDRVATQAEAERQRLASGLAAIQSLDDAVRSERDFIAVLERTLADQATLLEQIGRYSQTEASLELARTLGSLEDWRQSFARRVLSGLGADASIATRRQSEAAAREFLAINLRTPIREDLQLCLTLLEVEAGEQRPRGEEIMSALRGTGLAGLARTETRKGWVYSRMHRGERPAYLLLDLDLRRPISELPSELSGVVIVGRQEAAAASQALSVGLEAIGSSDGLECGLRLLSMLDDVRHAEDRDPMLVLAILAEGWRQWIRHFGDLDPVTRQEVRQWLSEVVEASPALARHDWVKGAMDASRERTLLREASEVVGLAPSAFGALDRLRALRSRVLDGLQPTIPVGVAAAVPDASMPRRVAWLDDLAFDRGIVVPVLGSDRKGAALMEASFDDQGRLLPLAGVPTGPVLLLKRRDEENTRP